MRRERGRFSCWVGATPRRELTAAAFVVILAAAVSCGRVGYSPADDEGESADASSSLDAASSLDAEVVTPDEDGDYTSSCPGGGCHQVCEPDPGECEMSCAGGGCTLECAADVCHFTCHGGGCTMRCTRGDCHASCSGDGCDLTCEEDVGLCELECARECTTECDADVCEVEDAL